MSDEETAAAAAAAARGAATVDVDLERATEEAARSYESLQRRLEETEKREAATARSMTVARAMLEELAKKNAEELMSARTPVAAKVKEDLQRMCKAGYIRDPDDAQQPKPCDGDAVKTLVAFHAKEFPELLSRGVLETITDAWKGNQDDRASIVAAAATAATANPRADAAGNGLDGGGGGNLDDGRGVSGGVSRDVDDAGRTRSLSGTTDGGSNGRGCENGGKGGGGVAKGLAAVRASVVRLSQSLERARTGKRDATRRLRALCRSSSHAETTTTNGVASVSTSLRQVERALGMTDATDLSSAQRTITDDASTSTRSATTSGNIGSVAKAPYPHPVAMPDPATTTSTTTTTTIAGDARGNSSSAGGGGGGANVAGTGRSASSLTARIDKDAARKRLVEVDDVDYGMIRDYLEEKSKRRASDSHGGDNGGHDQRAVGRDDQRDGPSRSRSPLRSPLSAASRPSEDRLRRIVEEAVRVAGRRPSPPPLPRQRRHGRSGSDDAYDEHDEYDDLGYHDDRAGHYRDSHHDRGGGRQRRVSPPNASSRWYRWREQRQDIEDRDEGYGDYEQDGDERVETRGRKRAPFSSTRQAPKRRHTDSPPPSRRDNDDDRETDAEIERYLEKYLSQKWWRVVQSGPPPLPPDLKAAASRRPASPTPPSSETQTQPPVLATAPPPAEAAAVPAVKAATTAPPTSDAAKLDESNGEAATVSNASKERRVEEGREKQAGRREEGREVQDRSNSSKNEQRNRRGGSDGATGNKSGTGDNGDVAGNVGVAVRASAFGASAARQASNEETKSGTQGRPRGARLLAEMQLIA